MKTRSDESLDCRISALHDWKRSRGKGEKRTELLTEGRSYCKAFERFLWAYDPEPVKYAIQLGMHEKYLCKGLNTYLTTYSRQNVRRC